MCIRIVIDDPHVRSVVVSKLWDILNLQNGHRNKGREYLLVHECGTFSSVVNVSAKLLIEGGLELTNVNGKDDNLSFGVLVPNRAFACVVHRNFSF